MPLTAPEKPRKKPKADKDSVADKKAETDKEPEADSDSPADENAKTNGEAAERDGEDSTDARPHPTITDKVVNDAAAYIRSLAQMRGRNAEWAVKAVREAASLAAEDALKANVIDVLAGDIEDLLKKVDGKTVTVLDRERRLETEGLATALIEPDWRTQLLAAITNPNIAYILMMIGVYGLIFEFAHPGSIVPGVVGDISLLVALFALHVLPINYAGLGLLVLGIVLMVSEVFVPSFGALGIGGVIAFVIGSVLLFDTGAEGYELSWTLVAAVALTSALFFMMVLAMALKARRRPVVTGAEEMIGSLGDVMDWSGGEGRVRVHGEVWRASAGMPLEPGQRVRVKTLRGLTVEVEPTPETGEK